MDQINTTNILLQSVINELKSVNERIALVEKETSQILVENKLSYDTCNYVAFTKKMSQDFLNTLDPDRTINFERQLHSQLMLIRLLQSNKELTDFIKPIFHQYFNTFMNDLKQDQYEQILPAYQENSNNSLTENKTLTNNSTAEKYVDNMTINDMLGVDINSIII